MKLISKIKVLLLGPKATQNTYIRFLKRKGVKIGKGVRIFFPYRTNIDAQNPHLLTIGNYVQITVPATILTHDYSWSVLKRKYGYIYGNQEKTSIGNNVFIGWGATILAGAQIGDNVIIGANSVVTGKVQSDSVYAGNPAKRIMSLKTFLEKRKSKQLDEAVIFVQEYIKRFNRLPSEEELNEYFFLFKPTKLTKKLKQQLNDMFNYEQSYNLLKNNEFRFNSFDEFIKYCLKK